MAQAKAIYTKVGVTPSDPVALRFHADVLWARSVALCPLPQIMHPLFLIKEVSTVDCHNRQHDPRARADPRRFRSV